MMGLLDDVEQRGLLGKQQFARGLLTPSGNPFGRGVQGLLSMLSEVPKPIERDPTYEYGSILPFRKNIATRQVEWSPQYSDLAKSAIDAFTAPGRALAGQIDPNSTQGIMEANNFAQTMMEGGIGYSAAKMAQGEMLTPSTVGMFAGVGAKTADRKALAIAEQLKAAGIPDEQIWKQTGWTSAFPDGKWRFEIPDNAAQFKQFPNEPKQFEFPDKVIGKQWSDIYEHPELAAAGYPQSGMAIDRTINSKGGGAFYSGEGVVNPYGYIRIDATDLQNAKETAIHELQHAIQQREGFARGGSPGQGADAVFDYSSPSVVEIQNQIKAIESQMEKTPYWDNVINDQNPQFKQLQNKLYDLERKAEGEAAIQGYKRLAGEAEARLTQARMNMTPEQRLAQYPYDPQYFEKATGVPLKDLIVRNDGSNMAAMSIENPYQINHKPMTVEGGASQLHDLTSSFGDDIYGKHAIEYFGSGDPREFATLRLMRQVKGNPNAPVTIYRGVPNEATGINAGDWVTLDRSVAQDYVNQALENEGRAGKVLSMKVPASHITSWPDSLLEFGYHPPK